MLPEGHDDESREQRPERLPEIAADLKQALREAVPAARGRARDARRLRVEHGAADADHRHRQQDQQIGIGESQQHQADQRKGHAGRQDEIQRPLVQAHPDHRLKEGGGELEDEGNEPNLEEAQRESLMEDRIKRRRERLHHVVEHVRGAERDQDSERRGLGAPACRSGALSVCRHSRHGFVPGRRVSIGARAQKIRPPKRPYVRYAVIMGASAPHCQFEAGIFARAGVQKAVTPVISAQAPWSSAGLP